MVLVYRPPRDPGSDKDGGNTERLYSVLGGLQGNVVVVGDFNLPSIDWERNWAGTAREGGLIDLVENKFWVQHVREPTHEDGNTLDLCISSQDDTVAGVEVIEPLGNGDHFMLEIDLSGPLENSDSMEEIPDWTKADFSQLKAALQEVDWSEELDSMTGKEAMDIGQVLHGAGQRGGQVCSKEIKEKKQQAIVDEQEDSQDDKKEKEVVEKLHHR